MNESINLFGLTSNQMRILFSLEYYMTKLDSEQDANFFEVANPLSAKHTEKNVWVEQFKNLISDYLKEQEANDTSVITDTSDLKAAILEEEKKSENNVWKYLILLECMLFSPYYPLANNNSQNSTYRWLYMGKSTRKKAIATIATWFDIDENTINKMMSAYKKSVREMSGYWKKIFIGTIAAIAIVLTCTYLARRPIVDKFAKPGLHGGPAMNNALANIGGGALDVGGKGIAGGLRNLIGGGILLGAGSGASVTTFLASTNPSSVMSESAKLYVVLKEVVLGMQHDTKLAQEIISGIIDKIAMLKKEVSNLKIQQKKDKERIKNLEDSIKYLEKFLKMSQK